MSQLAHLYRRQLQPQAQETGWGLHFRASGGDEMATARFARDVWALFPHVMPRKRLQQW